MEEISHLMACWGSQHSLDAIGPSSSCRDGRLGSKAGYFKDCHESQQMQEMQELQETKEKNSLRGLVSAVW